jgi:hypothetical protein
MLRQFLDIELFIENKINIPSIAYYLCHDLFLSFRKGSPVCRLSPSARLPV